MSELMPYDDPRRPVMTLADLDTLDPVEITEGFHDGYEGFPCSGNRSRAYWHGWSNAMRDRQKLPWSPESALLAREWLHRERNKVG